MAAVPASHFPLTPLGEFLLTRGTTSRRCGSSRSGLGAALQTSGDCPEQIGRAAALRCAHARERLECKSYRPSPATPGSDAPLPGLHHSPGGYSTDTVPPDSRRRGRLAASGRCAQSACGTGGAPRRTKLRAPPAPPLRSALRPLRTAPRASSLGWKNHHQSSQHLILDPRA